MYTVLGFERERLVRGDPSFSRLFRDRIEDILAFYASLQDARGFVDARRVEPYGYFPDWTATDETGPDPHGAPPLSWRSRGECWAWKRSRRATACAPSRPSGAASSGHEVPSRRPRG
jgi:hypothetical protein